MNRAKAARRVRSGSEIKAAVASAGRAGVSRGKSAGRTRSRGTSSVFGLEARFMIFLVVALVTTVYGCIHYLSLREARIAQVREIESLNRRIMTLRSENDALQEGVDHSIDWDYVRTTAVEKLGMKYPDESRIIWYNTDCNDYLIQYREVPSGNS